MHTKKGNCILTFWVGNQLLLVSYLVMWLTEKRQHANLQNNQAIRMLNSTIWYNNYLREKSQEKVYKSAIITSIAETAADMTLQKVNKYSERRRRREK